MSAHSTAINSFNENHSEYDKLRPEFTDEIVHQFLSGLKLTITDGSSKYNHSKIILELAAGTGKFTKKLVQAGWGHNGNLKVVEPSEGMLKTFKTNFPQVDAKKGSSYEIPLPDQSVDVIIVAQGFHWFSDEASLKEMHRVLKKSDDTGFIGFIWNYDYPYPAQILSHKDTRVTYLFENMSEEEQKSLLELSQKFSGKEAPYKLSLEFFKDFEWVEKVTKFVYGHDQGVPQYRHNKWRETLDKFESIYFAPIIRELFLLKYDTIPKTSVFPYWETRSYITALSEDARQQVRDTVSSLLDETIKTSDFVSDGILKKPIGTHAVISKTV